MPEISAYQFCYADYIVINFTVNIPSIHASIVNYQSKHHISLITSVLIDQLVPKSIKGTIWISCISIEFTVQYKQYR